MRRAAAVAVIGLALGAGGARAELSRAALAQVGVRASAGAALPLGLAFRDQGGRAATLRTALTATPGVVVFEDFRCRTLCGPALSIVAAGVRQSGLVPGHDFRLIAIGLNPRETPSDAAALIASRLSDDAALARSSDFLTGSALAIQAATRALGYGYAYDPETDQFTHPVAAFVLATDGRLTRVLPETALTGADLRDAVHDAGRGQVGDLVDRLAVFCHDLIPLSGRYDGAIQTGLRWAGLVTLAGMAAGMVALARRRRAA